MCIGKHSPFLIVFSRRTQKMKRTFGKNSETSRAYKRRRIMVGIVGITSAGFISLTPPGWYDANTKRNTGKQVRRNIIVNARKKTRGRKAEETLDKTRESKVVPTDPLTSRGEVPILKTDQTDSRKDSVIRRYSELSDQAERRQKRLRSCRLREPHQVMHM